MTIFYSKYITTAANIAAGAESREIFISEADQHASGPFDTITILNADSVALQVNQDGNSSNAITVLPNSRETGTGIKFLGFTITNKDAATAHTAGKVHIIVENTKFPRRS